MATEDIGHFVPDLLRSSSFLCLVDPQRLNPRDSGKLRGPWCAPLLGRAASGSARGDDDSCRGASRCLVGQAHKTAGRVPPAVTRRLKIRAAPRRTHPPALNKPEMPAVRAWTGRPAAGRPEGPAAPLPGDRSFRDRNAIFIQKFLQISPCRPVAGRPGAGRPAAGRPRYILINFENKNIFL